MSEFGNCAVCGLWREERQCLAKKAEHCWLTSSWSGDVKEPNNDSLGEMLEATRAELRKATAKIAKLEAEKADLVNMVVIYAYRAEQAKI